MLYLSAVLLLLQFSTVYAHWYLSCIDPGTGCVEGSHMAPYNDAVAPGPKGWLRTAPIAPADSNADMLCGSSGVPDASVAPLPIQAGAQLTAQFLHDRSSAVPYSTRMNANHHGFAFAYLAPLESKGQGKVWTKIFWEGLDAGATAESTGWLEPANTDSCADGSAAEGCKVGNFVGWWATDKMRMNSGKVPFSVPSGVPSGKYLLRTELLTTFLPGTVATAQSYLGCTVVENGGEGQDQSATLPQIAAESTGELPGAYTGKGSEWIYYDLHAHYAENNIPGPPGPPVWTGGGSGNGTSGGNGQQGNQPGGQPGGQPKGKKRRRRDRSLHEASSV